MTPYNDISEKEVRPVNNSQVMATFIHHLIWGSLYFIHSLFNFKVTFSHNYL